MNQNKPQPNFVGHSIGAGVKLGSILGIAYYFILFQFMLSIYVMYAAIFGMFSGLILGLINGVILEFMTVRFYQAASSSSLPKFKILLTSSIVMLMVSFVALYLIFSIYAIPGYSNIFLFTLPIAFVASAAISYTNYRVLVGYAEEKTVNLE